MQNQEDLSPSPTGERLRPQMKVLIDFTQIPLMRTGVGVYADHLVSELALLLEPEDELFVLIQDDERAVRSRLTPKARRIQFKTIHSGFFRNRLALLTYEQIGLPLLLRKLKIDVVHSLHYTFPLLSPASRVVTVHDLTFFLWPQMHTWSRRVIFRPFIRAALRLPEAVVFVSESTRRDADQLCANQKQRRVVTRLGLGPEAFVRPIEQVIAEDLRAMHLKQPYVLFVGTIEPRKNTAGLVKAFDAVAGGFPGLTLVLAGKMGWHGEEFERAIASAQSRTRILRLGYVNESQRQSLLASAAVLAYPSFYEGFGLPVLEAMALGVPVVTSKVSSLPEVTGDAALLVDPASTAEIARAIRALLTDADMAARLAARGVDRARKFRWSDTAAQTYAAYRAMKRAD